MASPPLLMDAREVAGASAGVRNEKKKGGGRKIVAKLWRVAGLRYAKSP